MKHYIYLILFALCFQVQMRAQTTFSHPQSVYDFGFVEENCFRLSHEDWLKLAFLSGNDVDSFDNMTLNRKGQPMLKNLLLEETYFRRDLRTLLKEEVVGYGYMSEKFRKSTAKE